MQFDEFIKNRDSSSITYRKFTKATVLPNNYTQNSKNTTEITSEILEHEISTISATP